MFLKVVVYFFCSILIFTIVLKIASEYLSFNLDFSRGWWIKDKTIWALLIYIFVVAVFFSVTKIGIEHFGKGVFVNILLGKFRRPKEQERIFMFIDLKDSTTIAEKLGHLRYTYLIQDCFNDLNRLRSARARGGLPRAGALEHVPDVPGVILHGAGQVGVARAGPVLAVGDNHNRIATGNTR